MATERFSEEEKSGWNKFLKAAAILVAAGIGIGVIVNL